MAIGYVSCPEDPKDRISTSLRSSLRSTLYKSFIASIVDVDRAYATVDDAV